jgi:hypothetical protein
MFILLFFLIITIVYIASFKESFTQENIEKVQPILIMSGVIIMILCILYSLVAR